MGIMIEDQEIIAMLTRLAEREGATKAQALRRAVDSWEAKRSRTVEAGLFPRERVKTRTYRI